MTYSEFVDKHGALVRFLVRRASKGTPPHLAEDLEQAAALGVVRGLKNAGGTSDEEAIRRSVASCVATELNAIVRPERRRGEREAPLDDEALELPSDEASAEELLHQAGCADALGLLIAALPSSERYVASGRFLADPPRTYAAIAKDLDLTLGAVRHLETRARALLVELASAKGIVLH